MLRKCKLRLILSRTKEAALIYRFGAMEERRTVRSRACR